MQGLEAFLSKNKEFEILKAKYSGNFIYDLTMFLWGWQRLRWQSVHCTSLGTEIQFPNTHLTGGCSMCCNPSPGRQSPWVPEVPWPTSPEQSVSCGFSEQPYLIGTRWRVIKEDAQHQLLISRLCTHALTIEYACMRTIYTN